MPHKGDSNHEGTTLSEPARVSIATCTLFPPNKRFTTLHLCVETHFYPGDKLGPRHCPLVPGGLVARSPRSPGHCPASVSGWNRNPEVTPAPHKLLSRHPQGADFSPFSPFPCASRIPRIPQPPLPSHLTSTWEARSDQRLPIPAVFPTLPQPEGSRAAPPPTKRKTKPSTSTLPSRPRPQPGCPLGRCHSPFKAQTALSPSALRSPGTWTRSFSKGISANTLNTSPVPPSFRSYLLWEAYPDHPERLRQPCRSRHSSTCLIIKATDCLPAWELLEGMKRVRVPQGTPYPENPEALYVG